MGHAAAIATIDEKFEQAAKDEVNEIRTQSCPLDYEEIKVPGGAEDWRYDKKIVENSAVSLSFTFPVRKPDRGDARRQINRSGAHDGPIVGMRDGAGAMRDGGPG